MPAIDVANADLLLTTTKQVRTRLDLSRPVPRELLLDCIDITSHAPMGGNIERKRWLHVEDAATHEYIPPEQQSAVEPFLAAHVKPDTGETARPVDAVEGHAGQ